MILKVGMKAPSFNTISSNGNYISLDSLSGKNVVLYFYPKDLTPGCTIEAQNFRDLYKDFLKLNTEILGVSKDTVQKHEKFITKESLPFPLLSDNEGSLCQDYGVWAEKSMFGKKYMGIERATFLIDKNGNIQNIWRKVKVKDHAVNVLSKVKNL